MFICNLKDPTINIQLLTTFEQVQEKKGKIFLSDFNAYCFMLSPSDFAS